MQASPGVATLTSSGKDLSGLQELAVLAGWQMRRMPYGKQVTSSGKRAIELLGPAVDDAFPPEIGSNP